MYEWRAFQIFLRREVSCLGVDIPPSVCPLCDLASWQFQGAVMAVVAYHVMKHMSTPGVVSCVALRLLSCCVM